LSGLSQKYHQYKKAVEGRTFPLAFVDMDLLDQNVTQILKRSAKKNIRVASKSIRSTFILEYILKSHTQFQGIMSFSGPESVFLSQKGFDDILLAYPETNLSTLDEIAREIQRGKSIMLMVDRSEHIRLINKAGEKHNIRIPVCIDIDMSVDFSGLHFGVWRSSIRSFSTLGGILEEIKDIQFVSLDGLMGYEAQIAGVVDNTSGQYAMNQIIRRLKKASLKKIGSYRKEAANMIKNSGFDLKIINGGGTGSLETTTTEEAVSEVTVGSGFYNSHLFDNYQQFKHQPAAGFACAINRMPKEHIYTCSGGGYIASGSAEPLKLPKPYLPEGMQLLKNEGAGEVQTPVSYRGREPLAIGDPVFFRHSKAGELCERFNELHLLRNGVIEDVVPTYRGEGHCFL